MNKYILELTFLFFLMALYSCVPNSVTNKAKQSALKFTPSPSNPTVLTTTSSNPTFSGFQKVIAAKCITCHNNDASGNFSLINSEADWLRSGYVTAGEYKTSTLYLSLKGENPSGTMPKGLAPALVAADIKSIKDWISSTKVPVVPTISSFTASSLSIKAGDSVTLSWTVTNAQSLSISGVGDVTGKTSVVVIPKSNTVYTLSATSSAGTVSSALTINIATASAPIITSFTTSAASIASGGSATLTWNVSNATTIIISNIGTVTGTSKVVTPSVNTTYTLTATNASGSTISSVTINIAPAPVIASFSASAATITNGESTALTWSVMNATTLSISGIGIVTGTTKVVNPTVTTTYTLTATGIGGLATKSVIIAVNADVVVVNPPVASTTTSRFTNFQTVMTARCNSCHSNDLVGNFSLLKTEDAWLSSGYITAGDIHSSLIYTSLKGETATGTMPKNTTILTAAEIGSIKDWITNIQISTNGVFNGYSVRMGNKNYVNSIFKFIFGESNKINYYDQVFTLSEQKIVLNPSSFQGACDLYSRRMDVSIPSSSNGGVNSPDPKDDWCSTPTKAYEQKTTMVGRTNSIRHGYLTQVCEGYVSHTASLKYALTTHHGWVSGDLPVNDDNLLIAYQNFYPEKAIPTDFKTALNTVASTTTVNLDKWKWVYLTLCLSAEWQVP